MLKKRNTIQMVLLLFFLVGNGSVVLFFKYLGLNGTNAELIMVLLGALIGCITAVGWMRWVGLTE